ncbi:MAG: hypothetical protein LBT22_08455 [Peptococcaceae bacterium]|nr:hypothetical protein [Peptococcaceae bacterium]
MISLRSGTPSSGKSYTAIIDIWRALYEKKFVIANFDVIFSPRDLKRGYDKRFFYLENQELTVNNLLVFAIEHDLVKNMRESQCLVVIDEAGGRFNAADAKKDISEWKDFFSQHAKLGFDILLIAQKDRMINRDVLGFIEYEIKHRKVNRFKFFRYLPKSITLFVAIKFWYVNKQREGSEFFLYSKRISGRYNRYKMFDGFKLSSALLQKIDNITSSLDDSYNVPISAISKNLGNLGKEEN